MKALVLRSALQPGRAPRPGDQGDGRVRRLGHDRHHGRLRQQAARGEARHAREPAAHAHGRARERRLGLGLGDRRRRAQEPRPRGHRRHEDLRQGLGAGALRQRRGRLGAQAHDRAVPHAGRRLDPVGRHHARRRARAASPSTRTRACGCSRLQGHEGVRPRAAPHLQERDRRGQAVRRRSSTWSIEPPKKPKKDLLRDDDQDRGRGATTTRSRRRFDVEDKFVEDFEIQFARDLVAQAKGWHRREVLSSSKAYFQKKEQEEQAHVVEALKKLGVDWTLHRAIAQRAADAGRLDQHRSPEEPGEGRRDHQADRRSSPTRVPGSPVRSAPC